MHFFTGAASGGRNRSDIKSFRCPRRQSAPLASQHTQPYGWQLMAPTAAVSPRAHAAVRRSHQLQQCAHPVSLEAPTPKQPFEPEPDHNTPIEAQRSFPFALSKDSIVRLVIARSNSRESVFGVRIRACSDARHFGIEC
jgi:hypothetical protein